MKLKTWNELAEEVQLPRELAVALMTGRSELLALRTQPLSVGETRVVINCLRVLMETNRELQQHSATLAEQVSHLTGMLKGVNAHCQKLLDLANFRNSEEESHEDSIDS